MKVSKDQCAQNRRKVLDTAAQMYREHGFERASVHDIMRKAGLTHGAFYGYFKSKEDLMVQVCQQVIDEGIDGWQKTVSETKDNILAEIVKGYLSPTHADNPGTGCVFATLSTDVARQTSPVRTVVTQGLRRFIDFLDSVIPGKASKAKRDKAITTYASMIGGVAMARAINDPALAREILTAVARDAATRAS